MAQRKRQLQGMPIVMDIATVADAVSVLEFLYRRELICQVCAQGIAVMRHGASKKTCCEACTSPNARYEEVVTSELEKCIIGALKRWNSANASAGEG